MQEGCICSSEHYISDTLATSQKPKYFVKYWHKMIENQQKICLIHVNIFNHICINSNKEMLRLHDTGDIIYTNDNLILI